MQIVKITAVTVVALAVLVYAAHLVYHVKQVTYTLNWYNVSDTSLGSGLPSKDPFGHPKTIVLARSRHGIVCYAVYYSSELARILNSSRPETVEVTYRVSYWFDKPYWIQELDIQHLGNIAPAEYMAQTGDGECF